MQRIYLFAFLLVHSTIIYPQKAIISRNFLFKEQIRTIEIVAPISSSWLKEHPAFDTLLNAQWFEFKYNHLGLCTEMRWKFCQFKHTKIDTSIPSLEHYFYFEYNDSLLTTLYINSFSDINKVEYEYLNNKLVVRKLFLSDQTKLDTVLLNPSAILNFNPYQFPLFPEYKILYLTNELAVYTTFNKVPINHIIDIADDFSIQLCPLLTIVFQ